MTLLEKWETVVSLVGGGITTNDMKNISAYSFHDGQIPPTEEEVQEAYDAQEYARNRVLEYPPIIDQLDMQFHDWNTWKDTIQAIKAKYPKPE